MFNSHNTIIEKIVKILAPIPLKAYQRLIIVNGKAIINLSVRDVFASRVTESESYSPEFSQYSFRQRGRFVTLGISYGFGKGEAMEFSGGKRF